MIVDCRWATIGIRNATQSVSRLYNMKNARIDGAVVHSRFSRFAVRKMRFDSCPGPIGKPKIDLPTSPPSKHTLSDRKSGNYFKN